MRARTLPVMAAAALFTGCAALTTPGTQPTTISQALDRLTGPAACGAQRAARAEGLIHQLDQLTGAAGQAIASTADALAQVQLLETQPRMRLQAGAAQLTLFTQALPWLAKLDPRIQTADSTRAAWVTALGRAGQLGFAFGDITAAMQATPCPAEEG